MKRSLTISLLGNPRIEIDGAAIEVDTRKAIALVAYLGVSTGGHSRDHLTALLWPEYDGSRGRAALRRTLSSLKKAVGDWLEVEGDSIDLVKGEDYWLDVESFRSLIGSIRSHDHTPAEFCGECQEPLRRAVDLYRGDFLEGFSLRDSTEFDDWQIYQSEALRREFAFALEKLVRLYQMLGAYDQALACAYRWLSLDPLNEEAHRQIMLAYARSGQRTAALRQYEECRTLLDRELGVAPLEETIRLFEEIRADRLSPSPTLEPPPGAAEPAEAGRPTSWYPLVGRRAAWESLLAAYRSVGPDGRFVLIQGEAGIGKTRLVSEFLQYVEKRGGRGVIMRSYEGESGLAYAPVLEGLRPYLGLPEAARSLSIIHPASLSEAARLLPEIHTLRPGLPTPPPLEGPGAQSRFIESLCQIVQAAASGPHPGLVFLDDLHWADGATLDFLNYLAHRLRNRPFLLLGAVRSEALLGESRLSQLAAQTQQGGSYLQILLERLQPEDLRDLLASSPLTDIGRQFEDRLYRETEGLPYFIVEYLAVLGQESGEQERSQWPVPGGVRDLLRSRLAPVDGMAMQLLTTAAVIGRSFDFETLRAASGRSEEEAVAGIESLQKMGLIAEVGAGDSPGDPVFDFSHEQLRSLVYGEAGLARRRLLHRRIGEALEVKSRRRRQEGAFAGQIAHHYHLGGREQEAADFYFRAGEYASSVFANQEAIAQYRLALASGHDQAGRLHETIGDLETLSGQYRNALRSFEAASAASNEAALPRLEAKIGSVYHRLGDWGLAESHFRASLSAMESGGSPAEQARVLADWSLNAHRQGEDEEAFRLIDQARRIPGAGEDPGAMAQVLNIFGVLARSRGDLESAQSSLESSLAQSEESGDLGAQVAALNNIALVRADRGDLDGAQVSLLKALELCEKVGDRHREAALLNNLADLSQRANRTGEALEYLKRAVSLFAEVGLEAGELQPEIWKLVEW